MTQGTSWTHSFSDYFGAAKAHFVESHRHPVNQVFHHITNALALVAIVSVFFDWRWTVGILVLTQVLALSGHFVFEKNQPAAVKYPGITILASLSWSFDHWFGFKTGGAKPVNRAKG
jgi:hypothetical protein